MNIFHRNIANGVTCLNLLSGCIAIIFAFHGEDRFSGLSGFECAFISIGVAAIADFMDGFTARLLHCYSLLGKELDSLSDLVSFGVAPSMIMYNLLSATPGVPSWLAWWALVIAPLGALRLARFNIDTRQTTTFIGLPIPANAIFWIGYAALAFSTPAMLSPWCFLPIVLLESWLMISPIRMFSLKFNNYRIAENKRRYFLLLAAIVMIACMGVPAFLWIIVLYLFLSFLPE